MLVYVDWASNILELQGAFWGTNCKDLGLLCIINAPLKDIVLNLLCVSLKINFAKFGGSRSFEFVWRQIRMTRWRPGSSCVLDIRIWLAQQGGPPEKVLLQSSCHCWLCLGCRLSLRFIWRLRGVHLNHLLEFRRSRWIILCGQI